MRRVPPGPERDAMHGRLARMHELMDAAVRARPFPVIGLAGDVPLPVALGGVEMGGDALCKVSLAYGDPQLGPVVMVRTGLLERDGSVGFGRSSTEELESWDGPDGDDAVAQIGEAVAVEVRVAAQQVNATYRAGRRAWSLEFRLELDGALLDVLVISREHALSDLRLEPVLDLEPFIAGRQARHAALRERIGLQREPEPEEWDLPPAEGLAAHEELIRTSLQETGALRGFIAGGVPRPRRLPDTDRPRRWESATRAQMALADESRAEATESVARLVNHLTRLADSADWFEDSSLAELAISECIEHIALHRQVPSEEAQDAWTQLWAWHNRPHAWPMPGEPPTETREELVSRFEEPVEAERAWQAAWLRWVAMRQRG